MAPQLLDHYRWMARYNAWFNNCLYDACEGLDDAARKHDRGAFFGSIHRTLNHLADAGRGGPGGHGSGGAIERH